MNIHDFISIIDESVSRGKEVRAAINDAFELLKEAYQLPEWRNAGAKAILLSTWLISPNGKEWLVANRYL